MPVDLSHSFPLTHEHALWVLHHAPWDVYTKKQLFDVSSLESLFQPLGSHLKRVWFLENQSFPLPRHYMRRFGIGAADDMVCLVIQNFLCQIRQEEFNIALFVSACQRVWRSQGKDPVTLQKLPPRIV